MRAILAAGFVLGAAFTATVYAQGRGAASPPNTFGSSTGFGRVLFPGTGGPPPGPRVSGPVVARPGGAHAGGGGGSRRGGGGAGRTVIIPYGVPYYVGGGYGGYGYEGDAPPPQATVIQQQAPPVIINQYYSPEVAHPVMREYPDLPPPARQQPPEEPRESNVRIYPPPVRQPAPAAQRDDEKPNITLLAFKDGSIAAAIGFWVQDGQLNYITAQYAKRSVAVTTLDKELSEQLNRERNVEFKLQ